nr:uncharacterized protein LOC109430584 [Aedes albopictus]
MVIRLTIVTALLCVTLNPEPCGGAIINLFIDAQKHVIAREEALLKQAQEAVKDRIDQAFDTAHDALMNVAEQVHYYATYPFRAGNEMIMSALGNATSSLAGYLPSFRTQPDEPAAPETVDEATFINRVQRMREQISRLSGLKVVVHTVSEDAANGPLLEIGFGNTERSVNGTGNGNKSSEVSSDKPLLEIGFGDEEESEGGSSIGNEETETTSYEPLPEIELDNTEDNEIEGGSGNESLFV